MMSEAPPPSRYVKLTKEQDAPIEEIQPGELNQPVHVPQLEVQRCTECGQPLPESYEPTNRLPMKLGPLGFVGVLRMSIAVGLDCYVLVFCLDAMWRGLEKIHHGQLPVYAMLSLLKVVLHLQLLQFNRRRVSLRLVDVWYLHWYI